MSKVNMIVLVLFGFMCATVWGGEDHFSSSERQFQREVLQAHNQYRSRHCAEPLQLDDELSQRAQEMAERNAQMQGLSSNNNKGYGQNSYYKTHSFGVDGVNGNEPVKSWYNGVRYYDFNRGGFSLQTGAFTQVVWASSERLGVGIAVTPDRRSSFIVTLYDPPGNFNNAFKRNVLPDQC